MSQDTTRCVCGHVPHRPGRCDVQVGIDDEGNDAMCSCEEGTPTTPAPSGAQIQAVQEILCAIACPHIGMTGDGVPCLRCGFQWDERAESIEDAIERFAGRNIRIIAGVEHG